jgi:hypothetical protein
VIHVSVTITRDKISCTRETNLSSLYDKLGIDTEDAVLYEATKAARRAYRALVEVPK